jgi:DNA repair protein RecO (recombination protein O)
MELINAQGILIRRIDYGDTDLILTFITPKYGKISVIAKSAKKSVKRFGGILELFYLLELVIRPGKGTKPSILQTASLIRPFEKIRTNVIHTAYASYWAELIHLFVEDKAADDLIYHLFLFVIDQLNQNKVSADILHIMFQIRFLAISGFAPNFLYCHHCHKKLDQISDTTCCFDLQKGAICCSKCVNQKTNKLNLSKGTIKHLLWISNHDILQTHRLKYSNDALIEGKYFLERFIPFCIGKAPKSLLFLKKLQQQRN